MRMQRIVGLLVLCAGISGNVWPATLSYPTKPVKLVLGYPAGGSLDTPSRILATKLGALSGQSFIVENRGGAGGLVAAQVILSAPADGYMLYLGASALTSWPALYKDIKIDPKRDFFPLGQVVVVPTVLAAGAKVPAKNIRELIALSQAKPGTMTYASAGNGTSSHFAGELFKYHTKADFMHVPYKGSAPAMTDFLGGRLDVVIMGLAGVQRHAGVKILAVMNPERAPQIPNIPTLTEAAPEYRPKNYFAAWLGVLGPRNTPQPVVSVLSSLLEKALTAPDTQRQMIEAGANPQFMPSAAFAAKIASEVDGYAEMVRLFNIKAN